ncbi:MAG TPA: alpha/beta hydrolase [Acidimicrobiia bacterium]
MSAPTGWAEGDVLAADGATLHYYRRGRGAPVVLAHGVLDDGRCWTRVAEALERDYDVIAYDARYHGKSDAPADNEWRGPDDLVDLVTGLGLDHPFAVGHSMGAATIASVLATRPDLLRAAVLADPPWTEQSIEPRDLGGLVGMFRQMVDGKSVEEVAASGRQISPGWTDAEIQPWAESKLQFRGYDAAPSLARGLGTPWAETVAGFRVPVLLVTGDDPAGGRIVTAESAARATQLAPSLEVVCLAGAGHNVQRDGYDGFVAAVTEFLGRAGRA